MSNIEYLLQDLTKLIDNYDDWEWGTETPEEYQLHLDTVNALKIKAADIQYYLWRKNNGQN